MNSKAIVTLADSNYFELLEDKTNTRKELAKMLAELEWKYYEQILATQNEEAAQEMVDEIHEHASKLEKLTEYANHLKRAKYREMKGLSADTEVTNEMLAETTEADMFPQASQFADEDYDEDDDVTTITTDGSAGEASANAATGEAATQSVE